MKIIKVCGLNFAYRRGVDGLVVENIDETFSSKKNMIIYLEEFIKVETAKFNKAKEK